MRSTLRPIYQHRHAMTVCPTNDLGNWVHRSQDIAHVSDADQSGARGEQCLHLFEKQFSAVVDGNHFQGDSAACGLQLPRHNVAMVFHCRDDHLVAGLHQGLAKRGGDEVDALGGAAGKDDFVCGTGVDESPNGLSGGLM